MMLKWSRRFLPMLCCVFALFFCAGSAPAADVFPEIDESGPVIVTTETAEVMEGPALSYAVITVVARGEIFVKQGRTGAWYYIRINDDTFGWISGRAISRYQADEAPSAYVAPRDGPVDRGYYPSYPYYPAYPYYPGSYYGYFYAYPFYFWGQPYFSSEYYYYDNYRYRGRTWGYGSGYPRTRYYPWYRGDGLQRESGSHRNFEGGRYGVPSPRPPSPSPRTHTPLIRQPVPRK